MIIPHRLCLQASQRDAQELRQDNEWLNEKLDEATAQVQVRLPVHHSSDPCCTRCAALQRSSPAVQVLRQP